MNMNTYQPFSWAPRANISVFHDQNMGHRKLVKGWGSCSWSLVWSLHFLWQGLTYIDQTAILDPISHLLPVKVDPLPLPITSPHGISVLKQGSLESDNKAEPTETEPAPNIEINRTSTTSFGLSNLEDTNNIQSEEGPKPDHFWSYNSVTTDISHNIGIS